jgi:hypothetical protein
MSVYCINIKHPRFQLILKQTDLPIDYVRAEMSVWMEENQTDQIPTAEDLGLEIVNTDVVLEEITPEEEPLQEIISKLDPGPAQESIDMMQDKDDPEAAALKFEENRDFLFHDYDFDGTYNQRKEQFDKRLAPNGQPSKLFETLMNITGNEALAKKLWMKFYTPEFRQWFGDWVGGTTPVSKAVDENGEPLVVFNARTNPDLDAYTQPDDVFKSNGGRSDAQFFTTRMSNDINEAFVLDMKDPVERLEGLMDDRSVEGHTQVINETTQDGVVIKPMEADDIYVTFKPEQVKPAFGKSEIKEEPVYYQLSSEQTRERDAELDKKVEKFLEKIGVSVHSVNRIKDKYGNTLNATAKADMLNKIVEVVNERASVDTLPEEAAHFFVEMLGENHPLYQAMYKRITDFDIYRKTVEEYKNVKSYRNEDGSINFDKMKKEAMGKAIALHIIEGDQNEKSKNLNFIEQLWEDLLKLVQRVVGNTYGDENPFQTAADKILTADTTDLNTGLLLDEEYFDQADLVSKILEDQDKIVLDTSVDPFTKEKNHVYSKDGVKARGSVTSFYVEPWLRKIFRGPDTREDAQKLIDIAKADYGDLIHLQIQEIVRSLTNPNGTKRASQSADVQQILPGPIYNALNNYVKEIMDQYEDPATVFLSEVKVFDTKKRIGGTIDFLVIEPDGGASIYDWKSQEIYKNQEDLKPYKEKMYRIQLEEYVKILKKEYGFKDVRTVRAIPIRTKFNYKDNQLYNLAGIEIGDIDPAKIPEEKNYLLPVVLNQEPTGDEQLDNLITQLNNLLTKMESTRTKKDEDWYKRKEEMNRLRLAIRDLQLRNRIDKLVNLGMAEYKKYKRKLENEELSGKDIRESLRVLEVFSNSSIMLFDMREEQLEELKKDKTKNKEAIKEFKETNKRFVAMTANIAKLIQDIKKYEFSLVESLSNEFGIKNIMDAEAELGMLPKNFQALSNINRKAFRAFSRVLSKSQQKRDIRTRKMVDELSKLKKKMVKWASDKNMKPSDAIEMMLNMDDKGNWNGNFVAQYQSEYYKQRAQAAKTGDAAWVANNTVFDEQAYQRELIKITDLFNSIVYDADEVKNEQMVKEKLKNWIENHNVFNEDGTTNIKALMNVENNRFLKPIDKWHTDRWNTLFEKDSSGNYVNQPVVDVYNYFIDILKYSKHLGMIDQSEVRKFIPSIYATTMESVAFGDISGIRDLNFISEMEVDSGTQYTPEVDPATGEVINRVPVYFTKDMGVKREDGTWDYTKKSRDLFKVFGVWAGHMYNYEAMTEIEDTALMLVDAERNKSSLVTDSFGNVVIENNRVKTAQTNDKNATLLQDFVNFYLYDRQTGAINDTSYRNRIVEFKDKLMGKEKDEMPKEYSLNKTVQTAVNYFGIKTLALNLVSGMAQLVGGAGNVLFQALKGQSFTTKTWGQAVYAAMNSKKARAALRFMDITEGSGKEGMFNELSLVAGERTLNKHNAFFLQRIADKGVTQPIVIAMMMEHMLDENKNVISIADYVKKKYNYDQVFYNISEAERESLRKQIDEEVGKLKEEKSLLAIGKMDENNKFTIEGIDEENESFLFFKQKIAGVIKKAIGNTGRDDINSLRTGMLGSAAMQFRSWMPEMMEDRFAGLKFDDETQTWTYGRYNLFFKELLSDKMMKIVKGIFNGFGGVDIIATAKQKYLDMKAEYRLKDQELEMTEAEFIDMYIGSMRSMVGELVVVTGIVLATLSLTSGGDDDDKKSGFKKLMVRAFKKFNNEFTFYLNPTELMSITSNPLPFLGLFQDFSTFLGAISKEIVGATTDNQELQDKAKPTKYFYKMFPVGKEAMLIMAAFDEDFRKEHDIRLDNYFYK